MARLKEQYVNEIAPALNKKFGYKSVMQIPKLDKVIINVAAGEAKENVKVIDAIVKDLGQITGQKAVVCKAKKSVANFKLLQGQEERCKLQAAPGHAHRRQGHPARRPYVRVRGSSVQRGSAPCS